MKRRRNNKSKNFAHNEDTMSNESDTADIFTDEISSFTEQRNKIDFDEKDKSSDEEEEVFGLLSNDDDESDEEIGEWSRRLKQIKFQSKLDRKKSLPDAPEKSWGVKRSAYYGSGVSRKPKFTEEEDDEWVMEEKEVEKLQQKLDEELDEEDFLLPSLTPKESSFEKVKEKELVVKRGLSDKEKQEHQLKLHPEVEPLRQELNKCLEQLETMKGVKGWRAESRATCFQLLGANIAFYLHLLESGEDCRGHPVLKRIIQWKKLAKMYEDIPNDRFVPSDDEEEDSYQDDLEEATAKRARLALEDSDDEETNGDINQEEEEEGSGTLEHRPVTYEIEKNKPKKKSAPNNPRVKHRERFRKAKIRRRGKIRDYKPALQKYQGEASGIRMGIVRSVKMK